MHSIRLCAPIAFLAVAGALHAATLAPLHAHCSIGPSEHSGQFSLHEWNGDCDQERHCSNSNHDPISSLSGITRSDLSREGASLTATLAAEAGTFTCTGTVQQGILVGESTFAPNLEFVKQMERIGFTGYTTEKLEAYAFVGVESGWVKSLQQTGVKGMDSDNLIALRIFNADPQFISSLTALGYATPDAGKLIALRVHKLDPNKVREIRALGFQPSLDELIQIQIFGITPEFIRSMQSRGLKDLTIAKLVQVKIFKLDQ